MNIRWLVVIGGSVCLAVGIASVRHCDYPARRDHERRELEQAGYAPAHEVAIVREPRALRAQIAGVRRVAKARLVESHEVHTAPTPMQGSAPCLVLPGDKLTIGVTEAELETRAGNNVLVGEVVVTHESGAELLRAPLDVTVHYERASEPERPSSWGIGGAIFTAPGGLAYGVAVMTPRTTIGPLRFQAGAAAGFASGNVHAAVMVVGGL